MIQNETEKKNKIRDAVSIILEEIGEDSAREGLVGTPVRVEKMFEEICSGYQADLVEIVNGAVFHEAAEGMILVRDIEFYSLCEHHLMPFFGKVHTAYIPDGRIIGLSKIPRIVDMYARRLQVQERMTRQILEAIQTVLAPKGIAVIVEASHLCARMRGVKKEQAALVTSLFTGILKQIPIYAKNFLNG